MATLRVGDVTKKRLVQARGKLEAKDGKRRSFEDVINELIDMLEER